MGESPSRRCWQKKLLGRPRSGVERMKRSALDAPTRRNPKQEKKRELFPDPRVKIEHGSEKNGKMKRRHGQRDSG